MSAGSLPASALTVWALQHFNDRGIDYTALITSTLSIALILTSRVVLLLLKKQLLDFSLKEQFSALRAVHRRLKTPITHAHLGTVDFVLLGSLIVGSLPGIYLGSHLVIRLPEHIIRPILASMLLIIGARFTFSF